MTELACYLDGTIKDANGRVHSYKGIKEKPVDPKTRKNIEEIEQYLDNLCLKINFFQQKEGEPIEAFIKCKIGNISYYKLENLTKENIKRQVQIELIPFMKRMVQELEEKVN